MKKKIITKLYFNNEIGKLSSEGKEFDMLKSQPLIQSTDACNVVHCIKQLLLVVKR